MNLTFAIISLLMALFLFFSYIRVNMNILALIFSFIFLGISIYAIREKYEYIFLIIIIIAFEAYIGFLKEKKDPRILKLQRVYKPTESILHYVVFGMIVFAVYMIMELTR